MPIAEAASVVVGDIAEEAGEGVAVCSLNACAQSELLLLSADELGASGHSSQVEEGAGEGDGVGEGEGDGAGEGDADGLAEGSAEGGAEVNGGASEAIVDAASSLALSVAAQLLVAEMSSPASVAELKGAVSSA